MKRSLEEEKLRIKNLISEQYSDDSFPGYDVPGDEKEIMYSRFPKIIAELGELLTNSNKEIYNAIDKFEADIDKVKQQVTDIQNRERLSDRQTAVLLRIILDHANHPSEWGLYHEPAQIMKQSRWNDMGFPRYVQK
jgi:hypothetical protein